MYVVKVKRESHFGKIIHEPSMLDLGGEFESQFYYSHLSVQTEVTKLNKRIV